jgi:HAMP domain-containing protein
MALLVVFTVVPIAAVALIAFDTQERLMAASTLDGLEAVARAKAEAIDQFTDIRRRDVERMSHLVAPEVTSLAKALAQADPGDVKPSQEVAAPQQLDDVNAVGAAAVVSVAPPGQPAVAVPSRPPSLALPSLDPAQRAVDDARTVLLRKLGLLVWDQGAFEELIVIDQAGLVLAATFSEHTGKTAAALEYFERGRRATYVQPVFLSPITNELTMVISTPIRDESNTDIGVLAARLNLKRFFRLINDYTGLGKTGETVVGKKLGDEVVFMAPTRHDDTAAAVRRLRMGSATDHALQAAARGDSGRGISRDYRGKQVYAAWIHARSLEWGVVTKIDQAEAAAPIMQARDRIIGLTLVVGCLVLLASLVASRALVRPLGHLKDAADRISKGNFDVELDIRSGDEIGDLADSFERMVAAIKYFRETSRPDDDADPEPTSEEPGEAVPG